MNGFNLKWEGGYGFGIPDPIYTKVFDPNFAPNPKPGRGFKATTNANFWN